ncbi:hypothetical protein [Propionicicella superfundia]|uniref:hypothetical protein n=1 Tax=Propionicicella superfundia TaxID=348582 RepID=UPI000406B8C2|nr:hypothetical protein [Propionicicella superfundia]
MSIPQIDALASEPLDEFDARILADLARVQDQADPPPAGLTDRIRFELSLRALQAELAELQGMSELETVRSQSAPEVFDTISFTASRVSLMITVTPERGRDDTVRIDAWVTTPGVEIELWQEGSKRTARADEDGRLAWDDVPRRPTRLLISGTPPVVTPTIEL